MKIFNKMMSLYTLIAFLSILVSIAYDPPFFPFIPMIILFDGQLVALALKWDEMEKSVKV